MSSRADEPRAPAASAQGVARPSDDGAPGDDGAPSIDRVLLLGAGYVGQRVASRAQAEGLLALVTTRREAHALELRARGFEVLCADELARAVAPHVTPSTHVVVTFPPDGASDARVAPSLARAAAITYVSSSAVYGETRGVIDDATPPSATTQKQKLRLEAESSYRALGATTLRCPGIYGHERGIHARLLRGEYRLPGTGRHVLSRIHVDDLARLILAAPRARGETFVVGDLEPASHATLVRWLCDAYGVPFPESVPIEAVHESLRGDRALDASRALAVLRVELTYPSYREGMSPRSI